MSEGLNAKLDVVTCCLPRDLPVASVAIEGIRRHLSPGSISVIAPPQAFPELRQRLGTDVQLLDERDLSGGLTIKHLRAMTEIEGFPGRAGWYLQQLVKLGYALHTDSSGHYLIWDSDTVPLRAIEFFTADGHPVYTLADEQHAPYFDTYESLFGYRPPYIGSFISQHMIIDRAIARTMLGEIHSRFPDASSWSEAIMRNLAPVRSYSLFSEYETYGNYLQTRYPGKFSLRRLPWIREGAAVTGTTTPTPQELQRLAHDYYFAAFEYWHLPNANSLSTRVGKLLNRVVRRVRNQFSEAVM